MGKASIPEDQDHQARSSALRLLARREHSRLELALKLKQRKIEADVIEQVLDDYEAEGWLSDERFAEVYARQRMDLGYGPLRIQAELQQRGIQEMPACVRQMNDMDWSDRATLLREKRFGLSDIRDDWDEKARQARFLARRGFSSEQVQNALEQRL